MARNQARDLRIIESVKRNVYLWELTQSNINWDNVIADVGGNVSEGVCVHVWKEECKARKRVNQVDVGALVVPAATTAPDAPAAAEDVAGPPTPTAPAVARPLTPTEAELPENLVARLQSIQLEIEKIISPKK